MNFWFILLTVLLISPALSDTIDYYWRDYDGDVPNDAYQAGTDRSGNPIYVGQGFVMDQGALTGTLHSGCTDLVLAAGGEVFTANTYLKILCSRHPDAFDWVSVDNSDIETSTDNYLVPGGVELESILYIGRTMHEDDLIVGKIYNLAPSQGLILPNSDGTTSSYQEFDVLTIRLDDDIGSVRGSKNKYAP